MTYQVTAELMVFVNQQIEAALRRQEETLTTARLAAQVTGSGGSGAGGRDRDDGFGRRGLIDVRELARMPQLEKPGEWADWSTRFKDAIMARGHPAARAAMDVMEGVVPSGTGCFEAAVQVGAQDPTNWSAFILNKEKWRMWANDLYYILEDMSKGDATVIIRNSVVPAKTGVGEANDTLAYDGFRAWRALKTAMSPRTPARRLQAFMEVVQVSEVRDKRELLAAINTWQRKVAKLETEYKEHLSASLRTALLISMLPKDMQVTALQAVDLKEDTQDEETRESVLQDIISKVRSVINSEVARSTPTPMEGVTIGMVQDAWSGEWVQAVIQQGTVMQLGCEAQEAQGVEGYEESHHTEIDAIGSGECFNCGQKGHRAAQCPKGKGKGKGKSAQFGKGSWMPQPQPYAGYKGGTMMMYGSQGKGAFGMAPAYGGQQWPQQPRTKRACFTCGSTEHLARACPKNIAAVENAGGDEDDNIIVIGNVTRSVAEAEVKEEEFTEYRKPCFKRVPKGSPALKAPVRRPAPESRGARFGFTTLREDGDTRGTPWSSPKMSFGTNSMVVEVESSAEAEKWAEICSVEQKAAEEIVGMTFQATDVKKALAAVWRVCAKGNIVQFGDDAAECFIKNKASNKKIPLRKKKGSYVMDVEFVIRTNGELVSLGKGEITVDSAAEESVCPKDWGGAFGLKTAKKDMNFKTASGQQMEHYGERSVTMVANSLFSGRA
jgi:hypothetical protein